MNIHYTEIKTLESFTPIFLEKLKEGSALIDVMTQTTRESYSLKEPIPFLNITKPEFFELLQKLTSSNNIENTINIFRELDASANSQIQDDWKYYFMFYSKTIAYFENESPVSDNDRVNDYFVTMNQSLNLEDFLRALDSVNEPFTK